MAAGHGESNVYSMYIAARFSQFKVTFYMVQLLELAQFILGTQVTGFGFVVSQQD